MKKIEYMLNPIDNFLNKITMYRLVMYYLMMLIGVAVVLSFLHLLPFGPLALLFSCAFFIVVGWAVNWAFAKILNAPTNVESLYISAFILTLIVTPYRTMQDLPIFFWIGFWTMASKYVFAVNKKHVFNPVAIAIVITSMTVGGIATWWVGTLVMLPFVLLGAFIIKKIRRFDLAFYFLATALATTIGLSFLAGNDPFVTLQKSLFFTPVIFFSFIMITEPLTTPPTKKLQSIYGALVGFLFAPQVHIGNFYTTPEIALVLGNVFSYLASPKHKLMLGLKEKLQLGPDLYDFIFTANQKFTFTPGQYMEWTLAHDNPDSRGNRRYFTLASSPTESDVRMGVKFYENASSFKQSLLSMKVGDCVVAAQLAGDFVLPKNKKEKLVFIAGGIGITPFRSMLKYLVDKKEKREVHLFYSNKNVGEIVYRDVFDEAEKELGIHTDYVLTDETQLPVGWGLKPEQKTGHIDAAMIEKAIPDYKECMYYLSGPHGMVVAFEKVLADMGVKSSQVKTDYFPGFA